MPPQVLSDHEWAAAFLQSNQRALEESYDALARELAPLRFVPLINARGADAPRARECCSVGGSPCLGLVIPILLPPPLPDCRPIPLPCRACPALPAGALEAEGIPFLPAVAGMFVWVDLR